MIRVGIDFDNTIACYTNAFYLIALEQALIPKNLEPTKQSVRNYLRSIQKEEEWSKLQGYIYGARMDLATPFDGVEKVISSTEFITFIISHKTKYPYLGPKYNLHQAAREWLSQQSFSPQEAFFELTLEDKLQRIGILKCDYFIDDLPELLLEKTFPSNVKKILFDPCKQFSDLPNISRVESWGEISTLLRANNET